MAKRKKSKYTRALSGTDQVRTGRSIASFLVPAVGVVTYFNIRDEKPKAAKTYLQLGMASLAMYGAVTLIQKLSK